MDIPLYHLVKVFVTDIASTRIHILVSFFFRCASFAYGYSSIPPCQSACNTYCIYTKPHFVQEFFLAGDLFVLTLIPWPRVTYMCFKIVCPSKFYPHSHAFLQLLQEKPLGLTSSPPYHHVKLILTYIAFTKIHTLISSMIIQPSHFFSHPSFPDSIFFKLSLNLNVKFAMKSSSYFHNFPFFFCTSCCQACIP